MHDEVPRARESSPSTRDTPTPAPRHESDRQQASPPEMVRLLSGDFVGIEGRPVEVQVDVSTRGCPGFLIVGLAGKSIRESRERIRAALRNSALRFPHDHRILVNLAPTAEQKDGAGFDLAVSLGILLASRQMDLPPQRLGADGLVRETGLLGELSLNGRILPVPGALLVAHALRERGVTRMIVAPDNAGEVSLVEGMTVFAASDLHEGVRALRGTLDPFRPEDAAGRIAPGPALPCPDFVDVLGQEATKRALLVAAAGAHNILLTGPPGVGKTMLARRLPGILPPLERSEAIEVTRILSVLGRGAGPRLAEVRPFRAPHHTISYAGLVGGGSRLRPGEVTQAHRGVLFLDELPEFDRKALEALREPLEEGHVTITRSTGAGIFPSSFLLVAAMNPCPCGYLGHPSRPCTCSATEIRSYRQRISGPLLDRIDLFVDVGAVRTEDLLPGFDARRTAAPGETTGSLRDKVLSARGIQSRRWGRGRCNSQASLAELLARGSIHPAALDRLLWGADRWGLSARGFARCLRVARTLADLEAEAEVGASRLSEALHYRCAPG